jgi:hypothetical protein
MSLVYVPRQGWNRVSVDSIYNGNLVVLTRAPHLQLFQRLRELLLAGLCWPRTNFSGFR